MRAIKICLIFFAFTITLNAQAVGQWKIYSDMKNVRSTVTTQSEVWAITGGGVFKFNTSDSSYTTITKAEGLNSQDLASIGIDKENKIWFGSQEGYINILDSKDNSISKIIDIFNTDKTQKRINDIFINGDTVFAALDFGLSLINVKTLSFTDSFFKFGNFPSELKVISAFKSNLIFVSTEDGVAIQKAGTKNLSVPEAWDTYPFGASIQAQSASRFLEFNGQILLATSNGVYRYINKSWQAFALQGIFIKDMFAIGNSIYLVSSNQLFQYSNGQAALLYENKNVIFNSVTASSSQTIYIASSGGIIEFKNNKTRTLFPNGPQSNSFVNLSVSPTGSLWIATGKNLKGKGFFEYDGENWKIYNRAAYPQLPSDDYINVYAAPDSAIYLSNWGGGVTIFKNNKLQVYTSKNSELVGIPNDPNFLAIPDIKTDSKGNVWVANSQTASRKPLSVLTKQNIWSHFSFTNPPLNEFDNLDKMVIDQFDTKWFTVNKGKLGLYYFNENKTLEKPDDDTQGFMNESDGLLSDLISSLAVDRRGQIWVGTNEGVNVITVSDPARPQISKIPLFAVRDKTVTSIAVDPLDNKWIGTQQGVFVLSPDGLQLINQYNSKNSPIPNDEIQSIAIDPKKGIVYIGTDYGLAQLQTVSIQPQQSFGDLFIYPNPFLVKEGESNSITIDGLIRNSSIKILSISGDLIRELKSPGGKIAFWDGTDSENKLVPTGIYIIVAYDDEANNVTTAKVAVMRK